MKMNIKVSTPDLPDLEKFEEDLKNALVERVKLRTPVRTGALKQSVTGAVTPKGIELSSDSPYVAHVEYGTIHMAGHAMFRSAIEELEAIADSIKIQMEKNPPDTSKTSSSKGTVNLTKK